MDRKSKSLPLIQADYFGYSQQINSLKERYLNYPRSISIETQVKCNAKCNFCPYPASPRKGDEMKTELLEKIINDLMTIPKSHFYTITLHRINEPLLDKRLEQFSQLIAEKLPSAKQAFWTNGSMLNPGQFEWMSNFLGASLSISLNSIDNQERKDLMGVGTDKVFLGLDYLHKLVQEKKFKLPVMLYAPFQGDKKSADIEQFCKKRWPLFKIGIRPFFQWMGDSKIGTCERDLQDFEYRQADLLPCGQWFDLHILSNGKMTKCCIDETGYINDCYDANKTNVLDMYSLSQSLRQVLPMRKGLSECNDCYHLG